MQPLLKSCRILAAMTAIALLPTLRAADAPATASHQFLVKPNWKKGEVFTFNCIKIQQTTATNAPPKNVKCSYTVEFRIMDVGTDDFLLQWTMTDFRMIDPPDPTGASEGMGNGTAILFHMKPDGTIGKLENWDAVKKTQLAIYDKFLESKPEASRAAMRKEFAAALDAPATRELMVNAMLVEPTICLGLVGKVFENHPAPQSVTTPLSVVNVEIPGTASLGIVKEGLSSTTVRQSFESSPEAARIVAQSIEQAQKSAGNENEIPQDLAVKLTTTTDATYKTGAGLPSSFRYENAAKITAKSLNISKVTIIEMTESNGPATQGVGSQR